MYQINFVNASIQHSSGLHETLRILVGSQKNQQHPWSKNQQTLRLAGFFVTMGNPFAF